MPNKKIINIVPVPKLKKSISGTGTEINLKAFTLVELIVVITILSILATIAFISFQGFSKDARDSVRISDLKNMEKGLEVLILKDKKLPKPENFVEIIASGTVISYQGEAGQISMGKA